MIEKLWHRSKSFPAHRATGYNDAVAALRDGQRLVNECGEVVSMDFRSKRG
jgi:hypothetical protein